MTRGRQSPEYKALRKAVLKRDGYQCQMPGCGSKNRRSLQVHHIIRWADSAYVRYEESNCIVLCRYCHYDIRNMEHHFIELFMKIVAQNENH